eukprot:Skav218002  [mRNA]  locus=scaffold2344:76380:77489:- [translate_table: standard]
MAFEASDRFVGARPGFVFKVGEFGVGYYADESHQAIETWTFGKLRVRVKVEKSCGVGYTGLRIWPAAEALAQLLTHGEALQALHLPNLPTAQAGYSDHLKMLFCILCFFKFFLFTFYLHLLLYVQLTSLYLLLLIFFSFSSSFTLYCSSLLLFVVEVLELGSGCGLVSAVAAALGARVTATDGFDDVLRRLEETAALNEANFEVRRLHWGRNVEKEEEKMEEEKMEKMKVEREEEEEEENEREELEEKGEGEMGKKKKMREEDGSNIQSSDKYDLILGADITYDCNMATMEALFDLISSCSHDKTVTLLAHGVRSLEKALLLWAMVKRRWAARLINSRGEAIEMPSDSDACDACPVIIFSFNGVGDPGD